MEEKAAQSLLSEDVKFSIRTTGLLYLIGIRKIKLSIRPLCLGTMIQMSRYIAKVDVENKPGMSAIEGGMLAVEQNANLVISIITVAILRRGIRLALFKRMLSGYLLKTLTTEDIHKLLLVAVKNADIPSFLSSIVFLKGQNVLEKKTSQNITGEIIAPGDLSETQSNITDLPGSTSCGE